MTVVLLLILQGRTSGGHGLLEAVPRIYQVTPDIPDRRRATKQKEVRPSPADSLKKSQLAARSGPSPPRRTTPTAESKQQASMRHGSSRPCRRCRAPWDVGGRSLGRLVAGGPPRSIQRVDLVLAWRVDGTDRRGLRAPGAR